jgi:hypothetical protein
MTRSALRITPSTPVGILGGVALRSLVNGLVRLPVVLGMSDPGDALLERRAPQTELDFEVASG